MEIVLKISFLTFNKVKINFMELKLNWKTYTLDEALPMTKQMQMIDQKKFAAATLAQTKRDLQYMWPIQGLKYLFT